jgi:hypothetical protein
VLDFLKLVLTKEGTFNVPMDVDIVAAYLMTQAGEVKRKHEFWKSGFRRHVHRRLLAR